MGKIKDLTGQKFGKLTVLEITPERRNRQVVWKCQCDCGNITYVVGQALRSGHTQSCGCKNYESRNYKNLVGQRFGKLTVIKQNERQSTNDRHILWDCKCDCGNIRTVKSNFLLNGSVYECQNCGNHKSIGEQQIESILIKNNINFIRQYSFKDCISPRKGILLFDFAIFDKNNNLQYIIEYDGIQHFQPINYFGGEKNFNYQQECDNIKNEYCQNHNIPIIRIPYTKKGKIELQDILL